MIQIHPFEGVAGVLEEVLRVPGEEKAEAGYYFRMSGQLYSTRLCSTPQGVALRRVNSLPPGAAPEPAADALLGCEVRRIVLADRNGEDSLAMVLDMGNQRYLHFFPLQIEIPAVSMRLEAESGEVEKTLTFSATMPEVEQVPPVLLRVARIACRLLALGLALLLSGVVCGITGVGEIVTLCLVGCGFALTASAFCLFTRPRKCPFCGESAFRVGGVTSCIYYTCDSCGNMLTSKR
ncbi:MAG: hypothetical protein IKJ58_06015 [Akkermansia sp.]|nr:hypothetical protein [Akkermansia sp.]